MGTSTKKKIKILFAIVFLIVILARPAQIIYQQRDNLWHTNYDSRYKLLRNLYYSSQYVKKNNPGIIPDETLESFAGGIFLKEGINPILIIHDQPPLGRYLISLSIFLFDSPSTIAYLSMFLSVLGIFLIAKNAIGNSFFALIPVALFVNEPLFLNKFIYSPLLEPIQLPFIIFAIYFFSKGIKSKNYVQWFLLTSLMLGFVISIRFFVLGLGLLAAMIAFLILKKSFNKRFIFFLLTAPLALIVLILSYTRTIQDGYSIINVFGIQKYILLYQKSKFILPFSFWDLLLFNRWHTWWGSMSISFDPQWIIFWPVSAFLTLLSFIFVILKKSKLNDFEKIILLWIGVVCLMLSTGYASTRYFLPLVPFLYILATSFCKKVFEKLILNYRLSKKE